MLEILLNNFDNNSYFDKGLNYYLTNEDDSNLLLLYSQLNVKKSNIVKKVSPSEKKIKTPNTYPKPHYNKEKITKNKNENVKKSVSYESYFN